MEMLATTAITLVGNKKAQKFVSDAVHTVSQYTEKALGGAPRKKPHHVSARTSAKTAAPARTAASRTAAAPSKASAARASQGDSFWTRARQMGDHFTPAPPSEADRRHAEEQEQLKRHMVGLRNGQLLAERRADGKMHFVPNPDAPERSAWERHADYLANGYGTDVMNFGHGEVVGMGTVLKDTAVGVGSAIAHPIDTVTGLGTIATEAITHPLDAARYAVSWARDTRDAIVEPFQKGDMEGMGRVFGKGLGHVGVAVGGHLASKAVTARVSTAVQAGTQRMSALAGASEAWVGGTLDSLNGFIDNAGQLLKRGGAVAPEPIPPRVTIARPLPTALPEVPVAPSVQVPKPLNTGVRYTGPATDLTERVSIYTSQGADLGVGQWIDDMERLRRMAQGGR